jgi:hypothetical protein
MLGASLALGTAAALLLSLGVRLWRTGAAGAPERWLALAFASLGAGILPRLAAAHLLGGGESGARVLGLNAVSHLAIAVAIVGLAAFVWRVFRPASRAAGACVGAIALGNLVLTLWISATAHALQEASALALALNGSRLVVLLWAFAECARYARLMRRRLALGLADPLLANRFVLWSVWTGALGFAGLLLFAVRSRAFWLHSQGIDPRSVMPAAIPLTAVSVGCAVICAGLAIWLAFFPPDRYRRWLHAQADFAAMK